MVVLAGGADPVKEISPGWHHGLDWNRTVPKAQADALVEALRRRGAPVEYYVYGGEGHGWTRPETVADELERSDRFLTRWVLRR